MPDTRAADWGVSQEAIAEFDAGWPRMKELAHPDNCQIHDVPLDAHTAHGIVADQTHWWCWVLRCPQCHRTVAGTSTLDPRTFDGDFTGATSVAGIEQWSAMLRWQLLALHHQHTANQWRIYDHIAPPDYATRTLDDFVAKLVIGLSA